MPRWWSKRKENGVAWKVKAADIVKYDGEGNLVSVNLDIKNRTPSKTLSTFPEQLADSILEKEQRIRRSSPR